MKNLGFALLGAAALALAACGQNEADTLNETAQDNFQAEELNALANNAAIDAEMEALGNQQQQLEAENSAAEDNAADADTNTTDPAEVEDDVQGM